MKTVVVLASLTLSIVAQAKPASWEIQQGMLTALISQSQSLTAQVSESGEPSRNKKGAVADYLAGAVRLGKTLDNQCKTTANLATCVLSATGGDAEFTLTYSGTLRGSRATIINVDIQSAD